MAIRDTSRTTEIRDWLNNLRYAVILDKTDNLWHVKTISFAKGEPEPLVVYGESFEDELEADKAFRDQVKNYGLLVKAETRRADDIKLFAEKIGYRITDPERCENCEFSAECRRNKKLVCMNPETYIDLEAIRRPGCDFHDDRPKYHPDWRFGDDIVKKHKPDAIHVECDRYNGKPFPDRFWERPTDIEGLDTRPKVDPMGICRNYKRRETR